MQFTTYSWNFCLYFLFDDLCCVVGLVFCICYRCNLLLVVCSACSTDLMWSHSVNRYSVSYAIFINEDCLWLDLRFSIRSRRTSWLITSVLSERLGSARLQPCMLGTFDIDLITHTYLSVPPSFLVVVAHIAFLYRFHATSYCCLHALYEFQQSLVFMSQLSAFLHFRSSWGSATKCRAQRWLSWQNNIEQQCYWRSVRLGIVGVRKWM